MSWLPPWMVELELELELLLHLKEAEHLQVVGIEVLNVVQSLLEQDCARSVE